MSNKNNWEEEFELEESTSDNKELHRFIGRVLSNWYWFLLFGFLGLGIAFIYLRYTIPVYKINAKLIVEDDKKGGGMLGASALGELSGLMGAKNSVDNEVEILRTTDLMHNMVIKEVAYIGYFRQGKVKDAPVLAVPYTVRLLTNPDSIQADANFFIKSQGNKLELSNQDTSIFIESNRPFALPGIGALMVSSNPAISSSAEEVYGFNIIPVKKVVAGLMGSFSAEVTNKLVSTIDLSMDSRIPQLGERLLGALINEYISSNLHDKNVVADSTLAFINARLQKIKEELSGVEDRISGYKQSTQLADISEQSKLLLGTSADYVKSMAEVETQLAMLDAMYAYINDGKNLRVVPSAVIPNDIGFNALVAKYNELVMQRERLLLANTEGNPLVINITEQISGLRGDMLVNLKNARTNLELIKNNQGKLAQRVNSQIRDVPTIERGYVDLARLQQIKQAQYVFLQEKWEETAIGRTANVSNAKIIDSPKADDIPISPKKKIIYIFGLIIGLAIPLLILYIRDLLNVRVRNLEDIKRLTNIPVLGMISHVPEEKGQIVVTNSSRSPIAEQFRAIRTNLEFSMQGGKTILMTSSMSQEGKSFVALNLAVSLALLDKKVLLMELDLRKPSLTLKLGLEEQIGFSHYVVRPEMTLGDIIMASGTHEGVDLIQAGAIPPNPAELLVHPRAAALMAELKTIYDYIIIDAPPVGLVTDAQLLSRYADICLYLVRQDYTYKEQLRIPNDLLKQNKMRNIELIINDVQAKGGYYSGYGYGYGYGYGDYGQTIKKASIARSILNSILKK